MKTKKLSLLRILWNILSTFIIAFIGIFCVAYVGEKLLFSSFYAFAKAEMKTPGTWDGFVMQGFDKVDDNTYLVSGYDKADAPSSIYVSVNGEWTECELFEEENKASTTHAGGVTHFGDYVYVAHGSACDRYSLTDILDGDGKAMRIDRVKTINQVSFCHIVGNKLYAGTFCKEGDSNYAPEEYLNTAAGDRNTSLIAVYDIDETTGLFTSETPERLYSITSKVQGMCVTASGKIVLSTSWGLEFSKLLVYDESKAQQTTLTLDGVEYQTTVLDSACLTQVLTTPPMAEELVYKDGRVIIMNESASTKYLFGKLTSGNAVLSYPID